MFSCVKLLPMALVLNYRLDEVNSVDIGTEYVTGANAAVNNNVTTTTDATYGNVANFNGSNSSLLIENIPQLVSHSSRTYSCWVSFDTLTSQIIALLSMDTGGTWTWVCAMNTDPRFYQHTNGTTAFTDSPLRTTNTWYHVVSTYDSTTSLGEMYIDGVLGGSNTGTIGASTGNLSLGNMNFVTAYHVDGKILDFRIYDGVLSAAEISALFSLGPNPVTPPTATPWSTLVELVWPEVSGATSYRVTYGSETLDVASDTLEAVVYNLEPLTLYTFKFYVSTDGVNYVLNDEVSTTTLSDNEQNANMDIFLVNGSYDLTILSETTRMRLQRHIDEVLVTGDVVVINKGRFKGGKLSVVRSGTRSTIPRGKSLLFSFEPTGGGSQSATLE